ncbi:MAG: GntR family transcriptional regulator [Oscillospiraceae bacterium]|jgi:K+/H+ antiporter YhaU regulatory subunit KhtT|nr:GntR family transcriptional regulator [Oscillospiraceae bacterium]
MENAQMENVQKVTTSAYRKIAIGIAENIVGGTYVEGQKLFGRSVLASHYKTSPETIRKAVHLLKDVGILAIEKGSGVEVVSVQKAREFIERQQQVESVTALQRQITQWARRQAEESAEMTAKIQILVDAAERLKSTSPLTPYELPITAGAAVIGKTADELRFWHNTGGTIIAIRRGERLIVSPGPYATFCEGDIFYVVGNEQAYAAAVKLLSG